MSRIVTDLSHSPYWDDYDISKQYYRILFVPKRAVQVREVNQMQTMIQEQVSRFGDWAFKDGSIVTGCNVTYIPQLNFIRCGDFINAGSNTNFSTETLNEFLVVSPTTGLRASIVIANPGYIGTYPDTNILYVKYLNKGRDIGDNEVATFNAGETLSIYDKQQDKFAPSLNPGFLYNQVAGFNESVPGQVAAGTAYAVAVGDGIIYQKGYFENVLPHTVLVNKFDTDTTDMMVGFRTTESIITYLQDPSLVDPVDTSQRNGIGANRLKLVPQLVAINKNDLSPTDNFFPIIEFGQDQAPVKQKTDPAYAALGDSIAKGIFEPHGDFYISPFIIGAISTANTQDFAYRVDPGIGYVKGNRVELIGAINLEVPRATDVSFRNANITTLNYGNYVFVKELSGTFGTKKLVTVKIYDTAQQAVTNNTGANAAPTGTQVGTAKVRSVLYESGAKGTAAGTYRFYITDIVMNSGKSFSTDAKAFYIASADNAIASNAKADIVLEGGKAVIKDSSISTLIFDLGTQGTKRLRDSFGANDTEFMFRDQATATLQANGSVTFTLNTPYAGGVERFFSSTGVMSAANKNRIDITTTANMTKTGNVAVVAGSVLDLANSTVTVASNTQFVVNLGYSLTAGAPQTVVATYPVIRSQANEIKKEIRRGTYVKIDCTANTTGPFNLGLVDISKVTNVWVGATYAETNPDRLGWFSVDSGQSSINYDHGKLILKPEYQGKLTSASRILVKLDHFIANTATGIGFFSVDSYPTRAPGVTANTTNISYEDIPEIGGYNLRNCIDFRPQKTNTANVSINAAGATVNPATTTTYSINNSGVYVGEPDSNFQNDMEYYLGRKDLIQVNKNGIFSVKSSIAADKPTLPVVDQDAMMIGTAVVPPYPGVASDEIPLYIQTKPRIKTSLSGNRTYTMKDINGLDKRITILEYYQALSMLESQAKDYTVKDENGLDRFKNGIFADPLKNHLLGDVSNFEYNIAIDETLEIARPPISRKNIDLDVANTTNIATSGRTLSLSYDRELFISQPYASKFRNATESYWGWNGDVSLYPEYDSYVDTNALPAVNVTIDLASPWEEFANSPFAQQFGDWRVVSSDTSTTTSTVAGSGNSHSINNTGTTTTTTTTTTTLLEQTNTSLSVGTSLTKTDMGSYVTDVTLNPFIRSRQVAFIATGLRPNTRIYAFFDEVPVSQYCAPGSLNLTVYDQTTDTLTLTTGKEDQVVSRTADFGTQLTTDATGNLYGIFNIPDEKFRVGDRKFFLCDVNDLTTGSDAILTAASTIYTASSITTTTRAMSITTIDPTVSTTTDVNTKVDTNVTQRVTIRRPATPAGGISGGGTGSRGNSYDPLGQSIVTAVPEGIAGAFIDSIGVFFKDKDPNLGITCYLTEMIGGVPDPSRVVGTSYLKPAAISVSDDASAETLFTFNDIPYGEGNKSYAFFLLPDGNSPNYNIWMSEVGATDILSGNKISSNPYIGVAFRSANSESWDVLQTEDFKFNVYRCKFNATSGTVIFSEQNDEYITTSGFSYANANFSIQTGDVVYTANTAGAPITGNTAPVAFVQDVDWVNDRLVLDSSTGGFTANTKINIYRPKEPNNQASISANNLIATSQITSVDNVNYSIVVPRIATTTPTGSSVGYEYIGTDGAIVDTTWFNMQPESELEFIDKMRVIKSRSNKVNGSEKSTQMRLTLKTANDYVSPIIDLRRRTLFAIENLINDDLTNEHTRYGKAIPRYLSRVITLAEGQDAEDIKVLISGYRPANTEISCFVKLLSADDPDNFYDKFWTKLDMVEGAGVRSSSVDVADFREFGFSLPTAEAMQGTAWKNLSNSGIVQYRNSAGAIFVGFKQFAIKLVLTSSQKQTVPRIDDVRAIALQI